MILLNKFTTLFCVKIHDLKISTKYGKVDMRATYNDSINVYKYQYAETREPGN